MENTPAEVRYILRMLPVNITLRENRTNKGFHIYHAPGVELGIISSSGSNYKVDSTIVHTIQKCFNLGEGL